MATLPTPFAAYSKGPGLTELLRPPASPFGPVFIVKGDRNDNEYSCETGHLLAGRVSASFLANSCSSGKQIMKLVPLSGWLCTSILPP